MKALGYTVVKNALANVIRGGSSAIAALVLPHFLTRLLNHDQFAAWSLMLQIAAYANYFDFGLQTAIARYLAQAVESGEEKRRDRLVSTAFSMLAGVGLLAFGLLGAIIWKLPSIFRTMPVHSVTDLRMGLFMMTVFITVALPMSTFTAVLIGLHRNEYPALAIGGSRILGTLAVLAAVHHTHSLASLAFCLGAFNLLGYVAQYFIASRLIPRMRVHPLFIDRDMARELFAYCSTLSIWTFGMLLVSGLDVTIVGYFDFSAVGYYSIAATLISFFTGFNNSIFSAMLTPVAVLQSRKEYGRIRNLIIRSTRLNTYANITLTMSVILWGATLLRVWVGPTYGAKALPILEILLVAQTIRLMGSAYATVLMAMGMQRYGLYAAITEGVSNLFLSVVGMIFFGAPGVAWGTFVAAVIGLAMQVLQVMRWAVEIPINRRSFLRAGVFQPVLAFLPLVIWVACHSWYVSRFQPSWLETEVPLFACILFTGWLIFAGVRHRGSEVLEPVG